MKSTKLDYSNELDFGYRDYSNTQDFRNRWSFVKAILFCDSNEFSLADSYLEHRICQNLLFGIWKLYL